jgi:hypothetical protein
MTSTIAWIPGGNYNIKGFLDDFRIYTRILTTTEITALYNYK